MATIQEVYIALFGRPADPAGLQYYNRVTDNGNNLDAVGALSSSPEYLNRFEGQSNVEMVNQIYRDLFGRDADASGLLHYVGLLQRGEATVQDIAIRIIDGATGSDQVTVDAKVAAANLFTASLDTGTEIAAYTGQEGIDFGQAYLNGIDTAAEVPSQAQVDAQIAAFVNTGTIPGGGPVGDIFTLTAAGNGVSGVDNLTGTADADNFRALDANSLSSSDTINGGAGTDVLNIADGAIAAATITPVLNSVERINNSDGGAAAVINDNGTPNDTSDDTVTTPATITTLNLSAATGVQQVWSNGVAGGGVFAYTNVNQVVTMGASGAVAGETQLINVDYAGSLTGRTTAQLATSNTGNAVANFDFGGDAAGIEAVSIDAVSGAGVVGIDADVTALDTITVTGAGRVQVNSAETTITTFNASANTGGAAFTSGNLAEAATVTGGSGNDVFDVSGVTGNIAITINAGAGNDIITGGAGRDVINAGEGNDVVNSSLGADTITLGAGNDVVVYSSVTHSNGTTLTTIDTITDFNVGNDTIDLSALNFTQVNAQTQISVQNAVSGLAADATLAQAVAAAAGVTSNGDLATFQFGGDTYVYGETNADDFLVRLTGNVALDASDFQL